KESMESLAEAAARLLQGMVRRAEMRASGGSPEPIRKYPPLRLVSDNDAGEAGSDPRGEESRERCPQSVERGGGRFDGKVDPPSSDGETERCSGFIGPTRCQRGERPVAESRSGDEE